MATVAVEKLDTKTEPLPLFREMEKQFDEVRRRAFELFERRGRELGHALEDWIKAEHDVMGWPAAELSEAEAKYDLALTLPGYDPKDVEVTVTPSEIIVHAKSGARKGMEEEKCLWTEFQSNEVYRRFAVPEAIDVEKTSANLDKGMLHIVAAKAPKIAKEVEVRSA